MKYTSEVNSGDGFAHKQQQTVIFYENFLFLNES